MDADEQPLSTDISRAEDWVKRVGIWFDREDEVDEHLFGPQGSLREHRNDLPLRARIRALWRGHRGIGVKLEREELERAQNWKDAQARKKEMQRD